MSQLSIPSNIKQELLPLEFNLPAKAQILHLLSLKECIDQYSTNAADLKQNKVTPTPNLSLDTQIPQYKMKRKKNHRKVHHKQSNGGKFQNRVKTQSQRIFKKRQAIEQNKKQLMRGTSHASKPLSLNKTKIETPTPSNILFKNYASIEETKKLEKYGSAMKKRAETISHVKLINKRRQQNENFIKRTMENRFKTFSTQYKNNYKLERHNMKDVDQQHKNIEDIAKELTNANIDIPFEKEEQKVQEQLIDCRIVNKTADIARRMHSKIKILKKQTPLKGLLKDRYQILQKIGKGLSGQVYKGKDILSERFVAIKVSEVGSNKESQYQFYKKVQHKNIVNYLNNFTENNKRYLILEYFPYTLESLSKRRKFTEEQVKLIFKNIANALIFLHGLSIAHRDIKFDNIVCSQDLTIIKFIDFGLCVDMNEDNNHLSKQFCGTMSYMPPEILQKKQYDPKKADIWSLGILLYKLAFDRFPYRGRDEFQLCTKIFRTKLVFSQHCNLDLKNLLQKMLIRNPKQRMTISEVIEHRWLV